MNKYENPIMEIEYLNESDIITTSLGTETTPKDLGSSILNPIFSDNSKAVELLSLSP